MCSSTGDVSLSRTVVQLDLAVAERSLKEEELSAGQVLRLSPETSLLVLSPDSSSGVRAPTRIMRNRW